MAKILLVEDDQQLRELLSTYLSLRGHEVSEMSGGGENFNWFDIAEYDLLIIDLILPECHGMDMIMKTRRRAPSLPIVAISGGSRTISPFDLSYFVLQTGVKAFLPKPFNFDELGRILAQFVPISEPMLMIEEATI